MPETRADPATLYPYLSYEDGFAAIAFLTNAFGFEQIAAYPGHDGKLVHAEMRFGNGAIMLGTATEESRAPKATAVAPGIGTYVYVADVDAHYERSRAAGATIVFPPEETQWGTRRYRARDPEGYEWSFGSYRPEVA